MNKKIVILSLLLLAAIILAGGVFWYTKDKLQPSVNQPVINEVANTNQPVTDKSYEIIPPTKTDCTDELDTACWNTYRNNEYGFEFRYPKEWNNRKAKSGSLFVSKNIFFNEYGLINSGMQFSFNIGQNFANYQSPPPPEFEEVGPLVKQNDYYLQDSLLFFREWVFEGRNTISFPENKLVLVDAFLSYTDGSKNMIFRFSTGGKERRDNLEFFEKNIIPTFKFIQ